MLFGFLNLGPMEIIVIIMFFGIPAIVIAVVLSQTKKSSAKNRRYLTEHEQDLEDENEHLRDEVDRLRDEINRLKSDNSQDGPDHNITPN